jgi:methylenetetrahydrofolate dehydrogenase (NADP+)/methenyltetrahydrofolate cyclohydrolase
MSARIIDCTTLSRQLREKVASDAQALKAKGITPGLAVLLVGDNPASHVYVREKVKACREAGLHSVLEHYDVGLTEAALLARIEAFNNDPSVHGILVQLPLPPHIDARKVIDALHPTKDVDGFHAANAGALLTGSRGLLPCTPYGCMKILDSIEYSLKGKHAVVIGHSNIVGKPMALMLLREEATVTICHGATEDLKSHTLHADILVTAVGKRNVLTADMVKAGAVVLDVGINRDDGGRLCGDVDFDGVREVAGYITSVPGGVGPMTITMLLSNTLISAQRALQAVSDDLAINGRAMAIAVGERRR